MSARTYFLKPKKYGNIQVVRNDLITSIFLHGNPIAHVDYSAMHIEVSSCGWKTRTTATALNTLFSLLKTEYRLYSKHGVWWIARNGADPIQFQDNMLLPFGDNLIRK
jgi:hypothetical protein